MVAHYPQECWPSMVQNSQIALAKIEGSFIKVINHIEKNDLIILDDFGLQPLDTNSRLALLQILEDFYERKSVIITSQLPVKNWYDYIGEPTLADAIMDRITSNSIRVEIRGESICRTLFWRCYASRHTMKRWGLRASFLSADTNADTG